MSKYNNKETAPMKFNWIFRNILLPIEFALHIYTIYSVFKNKLFLTILGAIDVSYSLVSIGHSMVAFYGIPDFFEPAYQSIIKLLLITAIYDTYSQIILTINSVITLEEAIYSLGISYVVLTLVFVYYRHRKDLFNVKMEDYMNNDQNQ